MAVLLVACAPLSAPLAASVAKPPSVEIAENRHFLVASATPSRVQERQALFTIREMVLGEYEAKELSIALDAGTASRLDTKRRYLLVFSAARKMRFPVNKELVPVEPYLVRLGTIGEALVPDVPVAREVLLGELVRKADGPEGYVPTLLKLLESKEPATQRLGAAELYPRPDARAVANESAAGRLAAFVAGRGNDPLARRFALGLGEGPQVEPWAADASTRLIKTTPVQLPKDGYEAGLVLTAFDIIERAQQATAYVPELTMDDLMRWMTGSHLATAERAIALALKIDAGAAREALTRVLEDPAVPDSIRRSVRQRLS